MGSTVQPYHHLPLNHQQSGCYYTSCSTREDQLQKDGKSLFTWNEGAFSKSIDRHRYGINQAVSSSSYRRLIMIFFWSSSKSKGLYRFGLGTPNFGDFGRSVGNNLQRRIFNEESSLSSLKTLDTKPFAQNFIGKNCFQRSEIASLGPVDLQCGSTLVALFRLIFLLNSRFLNPESQVRKCKDAVRMI